MGVVNNEMGNNIDECVLKLKRWLVLGYSERFRCDCPEQEPDYDALELGPAGPSCEARLKHMRVKGRFLNINPPAELLDALPIAPGAFNQKGLDCLRG